VTLTTSLLGVKYTRTPLYQSAYKILSVQLYELQRYDWGKT